MKIDVIQKEYHLQSVFEFSHLITYLGNLVTSQKFDEYAAFLKTDFG